MRDKLAVIIEEARKRCFNPNCKSYARYGGRGITVCEEWCVQSPHGQGFKNFKEYVLSLFPNVYDLINEGYSLERIDVNGNYEPGNIKFATPAEQANNRRNTTWVVYKGTKMSIMDAYRMSKSPLSWETVRKRVTKYGWQIEEALMNPIVKTRRKGSRV